MFNSKIHKPKGEEKKKKIKRIGAVAMMLQ